MCGKCPGGIHSPHDEDGVVFDNPWMWEDDELVDQWRQGTGTDLTPKG